jgi:hypothetical protein
LSAAKVTKAKKALAVKVKKAFCGQLNISQTITAPFHRSFSIMRIC